jgi:hypothetical protein
MNRQQPICTGTDHEGRLQWAWVPMELWQILQLYRRQYQGDFGEQWMRMVLMQSHGLGWSNE